MNFSFSTKDLKNISGKFETQSDFLIQGVSSINNLRSNTLLFINRLRVDVIDKLQTVSQCIVLANKRQEADFQCIKDKHVVIFVTNPRLEYARMLQFILKQTMGCQAEECFAVNIGANFQVGQSTSIASHVIIGNNVSIGNFCKIKAGAIINDNVKIGDGTVIREHAVIGGDGFGFERDEDGIPIRIPHLGGVVIGKDVEVGAFTTICAGTIEPTIIEDYTKIDDHVHIAHNCHIGSKCLITACAEISGSVRIKDETWLGPQSAVIEKTHIGKKCLVGIGAIVTRKVDDGSIVAGNPAKTLEMIKNEKEIYERVAAAVEGKDPNK